MLKIKTTHSYSWPVEVSEPADGGRFDKRTFDVTFRVIPQDQIDQILDGSKVDQTLLKTVVTGWQGVVDEDDNPVPFSPAALDQLINIPYCRVGLVDAFLGSIGGDGARRKN